MRVVAGTARGTVLKTPDGMLTRPTADRVKEAVFSILHFDVQDAVVLDLFGGTGQLGIEALSRGAKRAVFLWFGVITWNTCAGQKSSSISFFLTRLMRKFSWKMHLIALRKLTFSEIMV